MKTNWPFLTKYKPIIDYVRSWLGKCLSFVLCIVFIVWGISAIIVYYQFTMSLAFLLLLFSLYSYLTYTVPNAIALSKLRRSDSEYILLLGSFSREFDDEKISGELVIQSHTFSVNNELQALKSKANKVEDCLDNLGIPVLRVGGNLGKSKNITIVRCDDDKWFSVVECLSRSAKLILVVPGSTKSLEKEVAFLRTKSDLFHKVSFVQPPIYQFDEGDRLGLIIFLSPMTKDNSLPPLIQRNQYH